MSGPIQKALKTLNESITLLDKNKHLIDEETYLIMKENLLSIDLRLKTFINILVGQFIFPKQFDVIHGRGKA